MPLWVWNPPTELFEILAVSPDTVSTLLIQPYKSITYVKFYPILYPILPDTGVESRLQGTMQANQPLQSTSTKTGGLHVTATIAFKHQRARPLH